MIAAVRVSLYRARADRPVVTSFGTLDERPTLIVEVEDRDGARGWGEVWCNFPSFAAEHRARFLRDVIAPMFVGTRVSQPAEASQRIDGILGVPAIQAGEQGLVAGVAAGLDQALWDLITRRQHVPLWRAFGGNELVRVYASGVDSPDILANIASQQSLGHRAFKLRVGFSDKQDVETVTSVRETVGDDVSLIVDANQAWTPRHAVEVAERLAPYRITWLEEPIRADSPARIWREVASRSPIPLSGGENIRSEAGFAQMIEARFVRHVQPDVGKWGGVSDCLSVGRRAVAAGLGYSPHWLGGGVGLAITLNLLGAIGGPGLAEMDVNPNPLRQAFPELAVSEGTVRLSDEPGFGFEPDLASIARYLRAFG